MAPRNFSEDGAVGANTNGVSGGGNFGQAAGSFGNDDSGMTLPAAGGGSDMSVGHSGGGGPFVGAADQQTGQAGYWGGNAQGVAGLGFEDGGAVPEDDDTDPNATDPQGSAMGASLQSSINSAMKSVQDALSYGRQLHGLGGGQQQASRMPAQPGNQSESGAPRQQPMPGPLPPTSNPFGKRADTGDDDSENQAMPSVPFSESQKPQPMPGPLPPTSNPFGKRADAGDEGGAIDTEEDA